MKPDENPNRPATIAEVQQLFKDLKERMIINYWMTLIMISYCTIINSGACNKEPKKSHKADYILTSDGMKELSSK